MLAGFLCAVFTGKHCEKEYATGEIPVWHTVKRCLTLMILDAMHRFHLKYQRHEDSIGETGILPRSSSLAPSTKIFELKFFRCVFENFESANGNHQKQILRMEENLVKNEKFAAND